MAVAELRAERPAGLLGERLQEQLLGRVAFSQINVKCAFSARSTASRASSSSALDPDQPSGNLLPERVGELLGGVRVAARDLEQPLERVGVDAAVGAVELASG